MNTEGTTVFFVRSIWQIMDIPVELREKKLTYYFDEIGEITDREKAKTCLMAVLNKITTRLLEKIKTMGTYTFLTDLMVITNSLMEYYLEEKKERTKLSEMNLRELELIDKYMENMNIEKSIIDACNIWIENCILYQNDLTDYESITKEAEKLDKDLLIDLYVYGFASRGLSMLSLSINLNDNPFYGISIFPTDEMPLNILKIHPVIYNIPTVAGNQSLLGNDVSKRDLEIINEGFEREYGISFSLFLGGLDYYRKDVLEENPYAIILMKKKDFIRQVNSLNPPIDGESFLSCSSINKKKLKSQLRNNDTTIWIMGSNKYRLEIRPIIELEDGNVIFCYATCIQSIQLWYSLFMNGGSCYSEGAGKDYLQNALEQRNIGLSNVLLEKVREILRNNYKVSIDHINVDYKRIFGMQEIDYGDYDILFYSAETKELFLAEVKYLSDSYNASGMIYDYYKMFKDGGYYDHCRARYDLVIKKANDMKRFINVDPNEQIQVHFLFVSSKPMELELQDKDGVVTFLSLSTLDGFIKGKLISEDGKNVVRPGMIL